MGFHERRLGVVRQIDRGDAPRAQHTVDAVAIGKGAGEGRARHRDRHRPAHASDALVTVMPKRIVILVARRCVSRLRWSVAAPRLLTPREWQYHHLRQIPNSSLRSRLNGR
jgi:hypothetical protein